MTENSPLIEAALCGDVEILTRLLRSGHDVNLRSTELGLKSGRTALMIAAERGDLAMTRLLLQHKADVAAVDTAYSRQDNPGWTALHYAASGGHFEIVKSLLESGADPNAKTAMKETPLCFAAEAGDWEIVKTLIAAGSALEKNRGNHQMILTQAAACRGQFGIDMVRFLLQKGARVDGDDDFGYTALHQAALHGDCALIELLLEHGANVNALDKQGWTPLDRAEKFFVNKETRSQTLVLLKAAGAKRSHELFQVVEMRKKDKRPIRPFFPARPDFTQAADNPKFAEQIRYFREKIGTEPQPLLVPVPGESKWIPVGGGYAFTISQSRIERLIQEEHADKLNQGISLFVYLKRTNPVHTDHEIGLLPTADKYQVISTIQPYGAAEGVSPLDVIDELKKVEAVQPFDLIAVGVDQVQLRFTRPISDAKRLGELIEKLSAYVLSPEDDDYLVSSEQIEELLRRNPRITLLWEH